MRAYLRIKNEKKLITVIICSVAAVMFSSCQEPMLDSGEIKFKKLDTYRFDDFKLTKKIRYFEIIKNGPASVAIARYGTKKDNSISSSIDRKTIEKNTSKISHMTLMQRLHGPAYSMMIPPIYTVRYIDAAGHEGIIVKPEKLRSFLGEIDTPAELQLWLSLTGVQPPGYSYKKEKGMYRVRWNFSLLNDTGMCVNYAYKARVDSQGRIMKIRDRKKPKLCSESQRKGVL